MTDDSQIIAQLLSRMESDILDFKESAYRIGQGTSNDQKSELIKDIICMTNTPRAEPAYILIGVVAENGRPIDMVDIVEHPDPAEFKRLVAGQV